MTQHRPTQPDHASRPTRRCPTVTHHPRVRRPGGAGVPGLHRAGAVRAAGSARAATTCSIDSFDCRTGGALALQRRRRATASVRFYGSFHEVRPDERIVQTFTFEGCPDGVALETATFEDLGDGRSRVTSVSLVDRFEDRDAIVASGMESGVVEGYEKLDELLGP